MHYEVEIGAQLSISLIQRLSRGYTGKGQCMAIAMESTLVDYFSFRKALPHVS